MRVAYCLTVMCLSICACVFCVMVLYVKCDLGHVKQHKPQVKTGFGHQSYFTLIVFHLPVKIPFTVAPCQRRTVEQVRATLDFLFPRPVNKQRPPNPNDGLE